MLGQPRSRWIFLSMALLTAGVCIALGVWQLGRLSRRRAANQVAAASRAMVPRPFPGSALGADQHVIATGTYDTAHEFILRGRAYDGAPGVEVATPLRIPGTDTALIVVRGFVPSDDATSLDRGTIREPGVRTVRGVTFEMPEIGVPLARRGDTTWDRLPYAAMGRELPYPVSRYALWQEKDTGMRGFPVRLGAPALSDGPHLNYALQWFAFAIIFGGGGIFYTFRTRDENRETRDETA